MSMSLALSIYLRIFISLMQSVNGVQFLIYIIILYYILLHYIILYYIMLHYVIFFLLLGFAAAPVFGTVIVKYSYA